MKLVRLAIALPLVLIFCVLVGWKSFSRYSGSSSSDSLAIRPAPQAEDFLPEEQFAEQQFGKQVEGLYESLHLHAQGLAREVFESAYTGYINLQEQGRLNGGKDVISIIDFSLSSKKKRLWIIDLGQREVLLNTWVSHGRGSGGDQATRFSNVVNSHQSSLGFYLTGEIYQGKHGRSLRLDGLDREFNGKARERAIVIHGASYVSAQTIQGLNRLGLSHGCPAVPLELTNQIIDWVHGKTMLYVHGGLPEYHSPYLDQDKAAKALMASLDTDGDLRSNTFSMD